jgi:hypothetical protein
VLDRASTFANPEIVKLLQTRFIPVAIDQAYQRRQKDAEGEFYRKIAGQSPRNNFKATTQGLYAADASGTLLGYTNNRGADRPKRMLKKALADFQPKKTKPHWYQFKLRTLLLAVTLFTVTVGCAVGWIRYRQQKAQENRARVAVVDDAVAAIEKSGGEVTSEYQKIRTQTWLEEQFDDPGGTDDPVGVLKVTEAVLFIALDDTTVEHLTTLKNLKGLTLVGRHVKEDENYFKKLRQALPNCVILQLY